MRVLHIIGSISRAGGGPSRSSQGLVAGLRAAGVDAWLMTLSHGEEPWIRGCDQFVNGGAFEEAVIKLEPDVVHLHGLWDLRLHRCAVICRRWKIPYVIAPRGMLEPWSLKQKRLKKRVARWLYQDRDLKRAAALHATAESEAEQFRKLGFGNYVIVSPNGVNVPVEQSPSLEPKSKNGGIHSLTSTPNFNSTKYHRALFVSRMHPKKGVLELVESWARVFGSEKREASSEKWVCELVYTLNGDTEREYEAKVKRRIKELGLDNQFIFTGPLNDDEKWAAYARADLFILPTYSENFGIVVAEALWAGIPVITTRGTPWSEIVSHRCGWWIDLPDKKVGQESRSTADGSIPCGYTGLVGRDPRARRSQKDQSVHNSSLLTPHSTLVAWPALDGAIREACGAEGLRALPAMGANGHRLVEEKYTWKAVVQAMIRGYEQIPKGGGVDTPNRRVI